MVCFPLFIDLKTKNCLVIGGGTVAARKIETLLRFGAAVTVISESCTKNIQELARAGKIVYREHRYRAGDLTGAFLAIAATNDPEINSQVSQEATARGIWINVVDDPAKCSFIFPAVVQRDQIVVGITTSGIFPALAKKIREKIEQVLPVSLAEAAGALPQARNKVQGTLVDPEQRKAVLSDIAQMVLNNHPGHRDGKNRNGSGATVDAAKD